MDVSITKNKDGADPIAQLREVHKRQAIQLVQDWVNLQLIQHKEPERAGVPKGDKIGPSKKKKTAALYTVAYPSLSLREIAKLAGTTEGTMKVWRTQQDFLKDCLQAGAQFGELLANTIETAMSKAAFSIFDKENIDNALNKVPRLEPLLLELWHEKQRRAKKHGGGKESHTYELPDNPIDLAAFLIDLLPFFNPMAVKPVLSLIKTNCDQHIFAYTDLLFRLLQSASAVDKTSMREFRVEMLEVTKASINHSFDLLMDPEAWTPQKVDQSRKFAEGLKKIIFDELDLFAGETNRND